METEMVLPGRGKEAPDKGKIEMIEKGGFHKEPGPVDSSGEAGWRSGEIGR